MRAFVAIDLPPAVKDALEALQGALTVGRPVLPENLHLTLAFLGEQPDDLLEEAHFGFEALQAPAFELQLVGLDTFGNREPSALVVGTAENEALARLHKKVRGTLRSAGMVLERQRFRPHVTLTRFRRGLSPMNLERLRAFLAANAHFRLGPFPVDGFSLFKSTLRPEGPVYDELARYRLI